MISKERQSPTTIETTTSMQFYLRQPFLVSMRSVSSPPTQTILTIKFLLVARILLRPPFQICFQLFRVCFSPFESSTATLVQMQ